MLLPGCHGGSAIVVIFLHRNRGWNNPINQTARYGRISRFLPECRNKSHQNTCGIWLAYVLLTSGAYS